jgi:hypothetical protein
MTTRKQRERAERYRRHGVDRPVAPQREQKADAPEEETGRKGKGKGKSRQSRPPAKRKPVPYPTLRRSLKRAPIFGLIWFVLIRFVLSRGTTTPTEDFFQAVILTVVMVPLLFMTDTLTFRMARRRGVPVQERPPGGYLGFGGS